MSKPQPESASPPSRWPMLLLVLLLAVAMTVQVWGLYQAGSPAPPPLGYLDKVVHVLLFAVPAGLARCLWPNRLWPVLALTVHAPTSELIQARYVPYRNGDPADVAADLLGILAGVIVAHVVRRSRRHR